MSRRCTCCQVSYPYPYQHHFYLLGGKLSRCCKGCTSSKAKQRYQEDDNVKIQARYHSLAQRSRKHAVACCTRQEFDTLFHGEVVCPYCDDPIHKITDMHVDHVTPITQGGSSLLDNLQLCCRWCNAAKHDDEDAFLAWMERLKHKAAGLTIGQVAPILTPCPAPTSCASLP